MQKILFVLLAFFSLQICGEQFVVKKKKTPSVATLKTNCCDTCGDLLDACSNMIENICALQLSAAEKKPELIDIINDISKLQRMLLTKSREILEDDRKSFFATANKRELQECLDKSNECHKKMTAFNNKVDEKEMTEFHDTIRGYMKYVQNL